MTPEFNALQLLEDKRVSMRFDDGHEVIALLLSATRHCDGSSRHRLYEAVEWTDQTETYAGGSGICNYAGAATLIGIEPAGEPLAGTA